MRGTHLSQVIKSQNTIIYTVVNVLNIYIYTVFTIFRLLNDFVCLYTYEFWLSLCKIARSSVISLLPLFTENNQHIQN
jgi:hypothetical protein